MIKLKYLFTTILLSMFLGSFAYNSLSVLNPERWSRYHGKIDTAKLVMKPAGIYTQCDLYLEFSSGDYLTIEYDYWGFRNYETDLIEVEYFFDLPQGAIVTDSWLWVGDDIVVADIRERAEATEVYEEIVGRQQDPSILFKNSETQYELRVYPMIANQTRKVKITYLLPNEWTNSQVTTQVPLNILNYGYDDYFRPDVLDVVVYEDEKWKSPLISGKQLSELKTDNKNQTYRTTSFTQDQFNEPIHLTYESPAEDGIYVQQYPATANSGFYQMALFPDLFNVQKENRNVVLAFDHDAGKTTLEKLAIWGETQEALKNNLSETDSFNIAYTKFVTKMASDVWLPATDEMIDEVFRELWAIEPLKSVASLPSLLGSSIEFIESQNGDGSVLLISSSSDYANKNDSDHFLEDFLSHSDDVEVSILDYSTATNPNFVHDNVRYYCNEYLYNHLASETGGYYVNLRDNLSFYAGLNKVLNGKQIGYSNYDVDVDIKGTGFTYSNYRISTGDLLPNKPFLQVGKYYNTGGIVATTVVEHDSQVSFTKTETNKICTDEDSVTYQIWASNKLYELSGNSNNRAEEVELSLASRVLTYSTAFLALDPNDFDNVNVCNECEREYITAIDGVSENQSFGLSVFPNPVEDVMNVKIILPHAYNVEGKITLLTTDGVVLMEQDVSGNELEQVLNLSLDRLNVDLEPGVYLLSLTIGDVVETIKVKKN